MLRVRHLGHRLLPKGSGSTHSIAAENLRAAPVGILVDQSGGARSWKKEGPDNVTLSEQRIQCDPVHLSKTI